MLQLLSKVKIIDNSGVLFGKTIKILKPKNQKIGFLSDLILISSQSHISNSGIKPGSIFKAIVVHTKKINKTLSFNFNWGMNSAVLVKLAPKENEYLPIGTRIKAPLSFSLKNKQGFQKIVALAKYYV